MKKIGIKLADGTFHPILEEGTANKQELNLTTVNDDQTIVRVDLYRSETSSIENAEYIDTLELSHMKKHPNGEPNICLKIGVDQENRLSAELLDKESGAEARTSVFLIDENINNENNNLDTLNEEGGVMLADSEEKNELDDTTSMDLDLPDLDLPDFGEPSFDEKSAVDSTEIDTSMDLDSSLDSDSEVVEEKLDFSDTDFDLPDFNDTDFSSTETNSSSSDFDPFSDDDSDPFADDPFSDDSSDPFADSSSSSSSGSGLDFSDLYDDDIDEGDSGKNQKLPMIICLVCAIVCVLAVLAMFFVTASKFNLFDVKNIFNKNKQQVVEAPVQAEPVPEKPLAPPAKEDEVVVITETENVVPEFPKEEEKPKPKEIKYKVKWGDTLWDLADAYYKNPWLYPKIAKYNNIKNPNYIVAGSYILIPEE